MSGLVGTNPNQVPTNADLGTVAFQDKEAVNIEGGVINNTPIGGTTPAAGAFTTLSATGNTTLGDASTDTLTVNGTAKATQWNVSAMATAPASATATGTLGEVRVTATYIYVCTANNTWKRVAIATW